MELSIVILAAGKGVRLQSSLPKVLQRIGAKPMLVHVVETAKALNPKQMIIVHGENGNALKDALSDNEGLIWANQSEQQGTGDAVAKALPFLLAQQRVLILYGDVPLMSEKTLQTFLNTVPPEALGLLTLKTDAPFGLGRIIRNEERKVIRIVEEKDANDSERQICEVNTGFFLVEASFLQRWLPQLKNNNRQNEYYLTDIVELAAKNKVPIVTAFPETEYEVFGVNDRLQQAQAERYYQQHVAKKLSSQGVWIRDPNRFDLRGELHAESDVSIDVNVILEGKVILRKGTQVGANCILINCDIGEGVRLLANSYLENVKIGNHCTIGPFARLRPQTQLADDVHVGNFVEIKNSFIGQGSKISHLSYIGDTLMGKEVNVGAGTITCNYDGVNKHQTVIEDNVQIGSDTQLIAPIRIGTGATIAAGSTVKKEVPAHQLTLTQQLNQRSKDWEKPKKVPQKESH